MKETTIKVSDGKILTKDYSSKNKDDMIKKAKEIGFEIKNEAPDIINLEKKEIYYLFGKNKVSNPEKYLNVVDELKLNGIINHDINLPIFKITSLSFLSAAYSIISYDGEDISLYFYSDILNDERLKKIRELTGCTKRALSDELLEKVYVYGIDYNLKEKEIKNSLRLYFTAKEEKYKRLSSPLNESEFKKIEEKLELKLEEVKEEFELKKEIDAVALMVEDGIIKHFNYYF